MNRVFLKKLISMVMISSTVFTPVATNAAWIKDTNGWWNTEGTSWSVGWRNINNKWYYFNPTTGYMQTGWINDKGTWYFANADGAMQTGWVNDNGTWYFTNQYGAMQTGIIEVDGDIYCLANNGAMLKGRVIIDGNFYTFDDSGKNISNEKPQVNKVFTKDESGVIKENQNIINNNNISNSTSSSDNTSSEESNSSSSSGSSSSSSSSKKPRAKKIEKIETVTNGVIKVYLDNPTSVALNKEAFAISCPGFSDMTIFSVETPSKGNDKNRVYTLKTAYYDDKIYTLHITLPSGITIDKDFESKYDCPLLTEQNIRRISENEAEYSYISDAEGYFYYVISEDKQSRNVLSSNSNLTVNDILNLGTQSKMNVGYNKITIPNLENKHSYTMHYVAQDIDGKVTPIKTISISSEVISDDKNSKIQINSISTNEIIDSNNILNSKYWFTFELSEATDAQLKLDNFKVSCSKGDFSLGSVYTKDNKTYDVYMKQGAFPFDNIMATGRILFDDGTVVEKEFYIDMSAPKTLNQSITRTSDDAVQLELKMDEGGTLYYSVLDDVPQDTSAKDPTYIYENGIKKDISYGTNIITIEDKDIKTGKYIAWATEDQYENRLLYFDYIKIPEYKEEENKPSEEELKIVNIDHGIDIYDRAYVEVKLNKIINIYDIKDKEITNLTGKKALYESEFIDGSFEGDTLIITILNGLEFKEGKHQIILTVGEERIIGEFETN